MSTTLIATSMPPSSPSNTCTSSCARSSANSCGSWGADSKQVTVLKAASLATFAGGIILSAFYAAGVLEVGSVYAGVSLCATSLVALCAANCIRDIAIAKAQKNKDDVETVESEPGFWTGNELSGASKCYKSTGNMDKFFKALNWGPKFIAQVIETDGGSAQVVDGLRSVSADFVHIRNGVGLWNALQSIPKIIHVWHEFVAACQSCEIVKQTPEGVLAKRKIVNLSTKEYLFGVASKGFKLLEWVFFNICFTVCAPAMWLNSWFKLGNNAKEVGSKFGLFFLMKDISLTAALYAELGRKYYEVERKHSQIEDLQTILNKDARSRNETERTAVAGYIEAVNEYRKAQYETPITTAKSAADIALGLMGVLKVQANPWISLSLGMVSSLVGLYEIWRDTKPGKVGEKRAMPARFAPLPKNYQGLLPIQTAGASGAGSTAA